MKRSVTHPVAHPLSRIFSKKGSDVDMTKGSITRHLLLFSLPLLIGYVFQQLLSLGGTLILMVPVMVFAPQLVAFFNDKPEVVEYGALLLRLISPFYLVCCINQIYAGALRGAGDTKVPMFIMLGSFVVFRQIYMFAISRILNNIYTIALAYPLGWIVAGAVTLIYYARVGIGKKRLVE